MRLYLVRHGLALTKDENPDRPLSEQGQKDVKRMASFLGRAGVRVPRVIHSEILRAQQTALYLSTVIGPGRIVEEMRDLKPSSRLDSLVEAAAVWTEDTMVVGHDPFMSRITSFFTAGDASAGVIAFDPGSVVCLERDPIITESGGHWTILWHMSPVLLSA
jgi:phosphohistidine phosphatase|tara:strand:- start:835 stop:1317 length:483 start_codon:yes stop_codon:yes gene_type:complete